jgi:hypothetical protein
VDQKLLVPRSLQNHAGLVRRHHERHFSNRGLAKRFLRAGIDHLDASDTQIAKNRKMVEFCVAGALDRADDNQSQGAWASIRFQFIDHFAAFAAALLVGDKVEATKPNADMRRLRVRSPRDAGPMSRMRPRTSGRTQRGFGQWGLNLDRIERQGSYTDTAQGSHICSFLDFVSKQLDGCAGG